MNDIWRFWPWEEFPGTVFHMHQQIVADHHCHSSLENLQSLNLWEPPCCVSVKSLHFLQAPGALSRDFCHFTALCLSVLQSLGITPRSGFHCKEKAPKLKITPNPSAWMLVRVYGFEGHMSPDLSMHGLELALEWGQRLLLQQKQLSLIPQAENCWVVSCWVQIMPFTSGSTSYKSTCHGDKDSTPAIPCSLCLTSYPAKIETHSTACSREWEACVASLVLGEYLGAGHLPPFLGLGVVRE